MHAEEVSARLLRPERWLGGLVATMVVSANVDQNLTNAAAQLALDATNVGPFGRISRSGSSVIAGVAGLYAFSVQPQLKQNVANNITTFWARKNGVDVPSSAFRFASTGANDTLVVPWSVTANLAAGDVITFFGITSAAAGAMLDFNAAGGGTPASPALVIDIRGFGPVL